MIQFVKFIALTIGLAFSGTNLDTNLSIHADHPDQEVSKVDRDSTKLEPHRVQELASHTCGYNHAIELMKKRDPDYEAKMKFYDEVVLPAIQKEARERRKAGGQKKAEFISIPIVFHIIHSPGQTPGSGDNLSDQTIIDQLETLNEDFAALNPGWANIPPRWEAIKGNPEIKFCLAEVDPQGMPSSGITRHEYSNITDANIQGVIKPETGWPTLDYYNVWTLPIPGTTAAGGVAGYAYLPYPGTPGANFDGTVLDYRFTGKGSRTLSHEIGHGFGLKHTWGSGGCGQDDGIEDTPLQSANTNSITFVPCNGSTWPMGPSTCNSEEHMYINYMDYVPSACRTTFSQGQVDVMRSCVLGTATPGVGLNWASRNQLVQNAPIVAPVCNVGTPTGGGNPGGGGGGGPVITLDYDAGIQNILNPTGGEFCGVQLIAPKVILTNDVGDTPLTTCDIRYKITGIPGSTLFNWSGNLAKGETEEVDLQPFTSPAFNFELTIWTDKPNGEQDENGFNDERVISLATPEVLEPNIFEDFEDEEDLPTSTKIKSINPGNNFRKWAISDYSAYNVGGTSAYFKNFQDPNGDGKVDILEFPVLDFAEIENPRIAFDIAYYNINNYPTNDTLMIRVSTDCGDTFTTVFKEGGEDLATVSKQQPLEFFPVADEWRNEVVELFNFSGADRMLIEFVNIGYGNNNLYIDNINLSDGCASNVQVSASNLTCPDECDGFINLILNGFVQSPQITWSNNVDGQSGESLEDLCAGNYSVTVYDAEFDCEFIQEIEITSPEEIKLIVTGTDITIPGADNGSVSAQAFGGTDYFTYEWNTTPVETGDFISGLRPGNYCVTATDQAGCEITDCFEIFGFECEIDVVVEITQPTCDGLPGTGIVTVTGANNPTIVWSQGGPFGFLPGPINNNLSGGPLYVTIIDTSIDDCEETFFFQIFPGEAPDLDELIENETGAGNNDGSIDLNVDGESEYEFAWSTGTSTTEEVMGLGEGTYMVTITDLNNGCEYVETYTISNLDCTLFATADIDHVSCFDGTNGQIVIEAEGGQPPYDYAWPSGPSFSAQFNLSAGIYPVTVSDDDGCRFIVDAIVEQPAPLTVTLDAMDESSPAALDGTVTANIVGGTPPYEYAWSNMVTGTNTISGLAGGIYLVTVTDANNCETVKGASVEGLDCPEISLMPSQTDITCFEGSEGEVSVVASGGTEPYTYLWTPGDYTDATVSNLTAGEYNVVVTDAEGCPANTSITLTQPDAFTISLMAMNESSAGAMDGSVESTVMGGVGSLTYAWSGPPSFTANVPNLSLLTPAEYCVFVTDESDCVAEACIMVAAGADPCAEFSTENISINILNEISCIDNADASVSANADGGSGEYTYQWSNGQTGSIAMDLPAGSISVTVTDSNGCEAISEEILIEQPLAIDVEAALVDVLTPGANDGSITINSVTNAIDPYMCTWIGPNEFMSDECAGISDLMPGTYTFTLLDANGCEYENTYVIAGEADPCFGVNLIVEFDNIASESILGANDGSLSVVVSGANGSAITYAWTDQDQNTYTGNPINNLAPGTYTVVVTDENGCTGEVTEVVFPGEDPCVEFDVENMTITPIACRGDETGTASVFLQGGVEPYTYMWSNENETPIATDLAAGLVLVTVTDANNCIAVGTIMMTEPDLALDLSASSLNESSPGANNGSATASLSGGNQPYSYMWTGPSGFTSNAEIIDNLAPGTYCVIAIDANGCERESCVEVIAANDPCANSDLSIMVSGGILTCTNSNIELTYEVSGGQPPYDQVWNGGSITDLSIIVDDTGEYDVLVTDANGCTVQGTVSVSEDINLPSIDLSISNPSNITSSDGGAMMDISSSEGFEVSWFDANNEIIGEGISISDLPVGLYYVIVTDPANGCISIEEFELSAEPSDCSTFAVSAVVENITCAGEENGIAQLDVSNGTEPYEYDWMPMFDNSPVQANLAPGAYQVTVTDANGCSDIAMFEILDAVPLVVALNVTQVSSPGANDGSMTAIVEGGSPDYSYTWFDGTTSPTIEGLESNIEYCVTVVDSNGCPSEACATLEEGSSECLEFDVELVYTNQISCFEANDGGLQVNILNAVDPVTYQWSNNLPATQQQVDLGPGIYSVVVTDANNCIYESSLELTQPESELSISLTSTPVLTLGAADGTATVVAMGGNEGIDYTYIWSDAAAQTTATATDLNAGEYCVTVGSGGCSAIECIEVFDADDPCIAFEVEHDVTGISCFGECDGAVNLFITGGEEPYAIDWSTGETGQDFNNACAGIGQVTITDANDCTRIIEFDIAEIAPLEVVVSSTNASDETAEDGTANAAGFGGVPPYTFEWDLPSTGPALINLAPDTYTVTITDANGCTDMASVVVGSGEDDCANFVGEISIQNVSCFGENDGSITANIEGGVGLIEYDWSVGNSLGATQGGVSAGDFVLTVSDGNNCELVFTGTIIEPEELVINVISANNTSGSNLSDGSISVSIEGGTGAYEISWNQDFDQATELENLPAGQYTISVEDENGCSATESIIISDDVMSTGDCSDLVAAFEIFPVSCFGEADGFVNVVPSGGTPPYVTTSSAPNDMLTGLTASNVTITVTDDAGCVFEELIIIPTPNILNPIAQGFDGNCGLQGIAEVVVSGGTPPFSIEWSNGATGPIITGLETGEYMVTVTDDNGCTASSDSVATVITEFVPLLFELDTRNATCSDVSDGSILVNIINNIDEELLTFMWDDGATTKNRSELPGGEYTLTIIDGSGCEFIVSTEVRSPSAITASYAIEAGSTNTLFNVTINATGGTPPYIYDWSDGSAGFFNDGLGIGDYTVTITDANNCSEVIVIEVDGSVSVLDNLDIITDFNLSPNPTTGEFYVDITLSQSSTIHMTVYNILGQHISHNVYKGSNIKERLSIEDRPAGAYYIRLHNEKGQMTKKLIKVD